MVQPLHSPPVDNGTGSLVWTEGGTCIANGHC